MMRVVTVTLQVDSDYTSANAVKYIAQKVAQNGIVGIKHDYPLVKKIEVQSVVLQPEVTE